jgi:hypothetical protein
MATTRTRRPPRQRKRQPDTAPQDEFAADFAQYGGNDEHVKNICALGTKRVVRINPNQYGSMTKKYKCRGSECDNEVHNDLGEDDECSCSKEYYTKMKGLTH